MIRPLADAEMAELSAEQARSYLDGYRRLVAEVTRGLNAAWALADVPGTGLALVRGQIVAFARDEVEDRFRQDAMTEAHEQMLWRDWVQADDHARRTRAIGDLRFARRAYYAFMRSSLSDPERRVLEIEDENRGLKAELERLRAETGLRQRGRVPAWRDGEDRPALPPMRSGEP